MRTGHDDGPSPPVEARLGGRMLDAGAERRLQETRDLLAELHDALARVPATGEDSATLRDSIRRLDDLFLLVVVGEFNAGKSAFINALLGERVLEEGVTPTTAQIHVVRYGPARATEVEPSGIRRVTAPVELLRDLHLVDTPGTNAILREHEQLTTDFVPRSDLVLFLTSADRPFTETERHFLEVIRDWGKKIVIVLNKVDILESAADLERVVTFVRESAWRLLGLEPDVFPVSARQAWRAKHGEPELWPPSRFEALERFVLETLDPAARFHLKLASPLGVADALLRRYLGAADERLRLLDDDSTLLAGIDRDLTASREDLNEGFELRMTAIENVLAGMEARGHEYFEETLRLARLFDLLDRARVQREFEERVVADAPRQVERRVADLVDWLVEQDHRQWAAVGTALAARPTPDRSLAAPEVGTFVADRGRLIDSLGREAQRVVDTYDRRRESAEIAERARGAVTTAAAVGAGALGLGTLVTIAASTAAADITGLVMAGVVAALGLLVIPARRRKARAEMREKVTALRRRLGNALRHEFEASRTRSRERLDASIGPYRRFVRAERERWTGHRDDLAALAGRVGAMRSALGAAPVGGASLDRTFLSP